MTNNQAFLQQATEFAAATLHERPYVPTALLQFEPEGAAGDPDYEVISLDDLKISDDKARDWPAKLRKVAAQRGAQRIAFINEAWLTAEFPGTKKGMRLRHAYEGWDDAFGPTPEGNAMELVSIIVESTDGTMLGAMYELIDDPHGHMGRSLTPGWYTSPGKVWDRVLRTERHAQTAPVAHQNH